MDYRDTIDEAAFRAELRAWLAENIPQDWDHFPDDATKRRQDKAWHQALHKAGYIGMSWPVEYGGRALGPSYDAILNAEVALAGAPPLPGYVNFLGRALWTFGTEVQKQTFLTSLLNGQQVWCQGYSEPGAGSDIGSLRTRAELVGDHYVVNGQKLWTSWAHISDWCMLLVRTDPDAPKHKGISCLLTPMDAEGITARPVRLSTGEPETGEVFLDDVRVPADQMLGEPGDGWKIAMTTLAYERGPGDIGYVAQYQGALGTLTDLARQRGLLDDGGVRRQLAMAYVRGEALRLTVVDGLSLREVNNRSGEESSVAKMMWIEAEQNIRHLAMDILGADALTGVEPHQFSRYLWSRAVSVFGGTEQIQKNILARRVLNMPT